jgi:hypothetical protein
VTRGLVVADVTADAAALGAALPIRLCMALVMADGAMLGRAVGGAVDRGGRSCTIERCVNDSTSGQRRVSVSMAVSKYEPGGKYDEAWC